MGIRVGAYSKLLQVSEMSVYDLIRTLKECFDFFIFTKEEDLQKTENDKKTNCAVVKNILFFVKKCINICFCVFCKINKRFKDKTPLLSMKISALPPQRILQDSPNPLSTRSHTSTTLVLRSLLLINLGFFSSHPVVFFAQLSIWLLPVKENNASLVQPDKGKVS